MSVPASTADIRQRRHHAEHGLDGGGLPVRIERAEFGRAQRHFVRA